MSNINIGPLLLWQSETQARYYIKHLPAILKLKSLNPALGGTILVIVQYSTASTSNDLKLIGGILKHTKLKKTKNKLTINHQTETEYLSFSKFSTLKLEIVLVKHYGPNYMPVAPNCQT